MYRRQSLAAIAAMFVAVAIFGAVAAFAFDEGFIYNAVIGETVPADLSAGLEDAIGDPNSPTGDGGAIVEATPAESPDPYPAGLTPVNGDGQTPPPFPSGILTPTNAYSVGTATAARIVYAGAAGIGSNKGTIIDTSISYVDGTSDEFISTSASTGAFTIASFDSTRLYLESTSGQQATYDLASRAVTLCGPPLSERICPLP